MAAIPIVSMMEKPELPSVCKDYCMARKMIKHIERFKQFRLKIVNSKNLICDQCDFIALSRNKMLMHKQLNHTNMGQLQLKVADCIELICKKCEYIGISESKIAAHKLEHDKIIVEELIEKLTVTIGGSDYLICDCGYMGYLNEMKVHIAQNHFWEPSNSGPQVTKKEKPKESEDLYTFPVYHFKTSSVRHLANHTFKNHESKQNQNNEEIEAMKSVKVKLQDSKNLICNECGFIALSKVRMKSHQTLNHKEKDFGQWIVKLQRRKKETNEVEEMILKMICNYNNLPR